MPKRLPGGKVKRGSKQARAREARPITPASDVPAAAVEQSSPSSLLRVSHPTQPRQAASPPRQSILNTVRRPPAKTGPALNTDYRYVFADLRRIGIVSTAALVVLVALSFVIR